MCLLLFESPFHPSAVCSVPQSCPALCDPMDYSPPGSSVHGILQARILEGVAMPSPPVGLPHPGIKPRSPALQANSPPSEPPGKPSHPMGGHRAPASCVMQQFPASHRFYPPQGVYFNTLSQFVPFPLAPAGSVTCSLCLSLCSCPGSRTPIHWTTGKVPRRGL